MSHGKKHNKACFGHDWALKQPVKKSGEGGSLAGEGSQSVALASYSFADNCQQNSLLLMDT